MTSAPGDQWNGEYEYVFQYFQSVQLLIVGMRRVECSFLENTCVGCSEFLWQEEMYQRCVKVLNLCSLAGVRELRWMQVFPLYMISCHYTWIKCYKQTQSSL